jgi:hypothetical protein
MGNINRIVQKTGLFYLFHAASLAVSAASRTHFQLQLGMKLLPVCVN